jgi:hypothetical protein
VISRRTGRSRRRWTAPVLAMTFILGLVLTACGFNAQTNLPYTPADGVSLDVGSVHVRNLMVLSKGDNQGFLSATIGSSGGPDTLSSVTGTVIKPDSSDGAALTVTIPQPVAFGNGTSVVLTDKPEFVTVTGDGLLPGATVNLTLKFNDAGESTLQVPVVDAEHPYYVTVSPSPSGTPSV